MNFFQKGTFPRNTNHEDVIRLNLAIPSLNSSLIISPNVGCQIGVRLPGDKDGVRVSTPQITPDMGEATLFDI